MRANKQSGFTLIEIMVVIAILGILGATAVPVYNTWFQRARGSETKIMAKQILDAEITYYLDNDNFFPGPDATIFIPRDYLPGDANVEEIANKLHITIPRGHFLDYTITNDSGDGKLYLTITSDVEIFKGVYQVIYWIDKNGYIYDPVKL